jgi:hypothetical protein
MSEGLDSVVIGRAPHVFKDGFNSLMIETGISGEYAPIRNFDVVKTNAAVELDRGARQLTLALRRR